MTNAEFRYWQDRAALLDPRAYEFITGKNWLRQVPTDETWYALNLWQVSFTPGFKSGFLRKPHADNCVALPSGTLFRNFSTQLACAYYCRPSLVVAIDPRYSADPRGFYYSRLEHLRSLTVHELGINITARTPLKPFISKPFPLDFDYGLATLASVYDASWVGFGNYAGVTYQGGVNALPEVNNEHVVRFAEPILMPFSRAVFQRLITTPGNKPGDLTTAPEAGNASILYHKLPPDW